MAVGTVEWFPAGPIEIRDATIARVQAQTGFKNVFGNRVRPTDPTMLPMACISHHGDQTEPWGEANIGAVRFEHVLNLIVEVMVKAGTEEDLNLEIIDLVEPLRLALLTDPSWRRLFDSVTRASISYSYPQEGTFLYARGVIEFEVKFGSEWSPAVPGTFRTMGVDVRTPSGATFSQPITVRTDP